MATGWFHIPQVAEVYRQREILRQRAATAAEQAKRNPTTGEQTMTDDTDDALYARLFNPAQPAALTDEEQQIWQAVFPDGRPELAEDEQQLYRGLFSDDGES